VLCVLPLLITAVFSGLTAHRIRRSVRDIPGETTGRQQLQHSRMVSSTVLFTLTGVFVISYAPDFLSLFLVSVFSNSNPFREYGSVNVLLYYLRFVNCCLNPIILFVLTKRYRGYIKRYCGQRDAQPAITYGSSIGTTVSPSAP